MNPLCAAFWNCCLVSEINNMCCVIIIFWWICASSVLHVFICVLNLITVVTFILKGIIYSRCVIAKNMGILLPRMDRERYQKNEDTLVNFLISALIGNWNMGQKSNIEHEQRGIFGYSQNHHAHICNRRIQSSYDWLTMSWTWWLGCE